MTPDVVLAVARSYAWVRETSPNRGEAVDTFVRSVGLDPETRAPWCAAFVCFVLASVFGPTMPVPKTASCAALGAAGGKRLKTTPAPGAVFLKFFPDKQRFAHTGFIIARVGTNKWACIEGNTNPDGGREGYGVFERTRVFGSSDRFLYWWEGI